MNVRNDIDVSKCESYCNGICEEYEDYLDYPNCEDRPNCCYKQHQQIQQLKAENDELKNKNKAIHSIADDLQQRNHNLTLENEELKEKINENNYCYNELLKLKDFFFNKSKTFYNCLDEIEEMCKHDCKECLEKGNKSELYCVKCIHKSILDTIKQAKEGE